MSTFENGERNPKSPNSRMAPRATSLQQRPCNCNLALVFLSADAVINHTCAPFRLPWVQVNRAEKKMCCALPYVDGYTHHYIMDFTTVSSMIPLPQSGVFFSLSQTQRRQGERRKELRCVFHSWLCLLSALGYCFLRGIWRNGIYDEQEGNDGRKILPRTIQMQMSVELKGDEWKSCERLLQQCARDNNGGMIKSGPDPTILRCEYFFVRVFDEREIDEGEFSMQHTQSQSRQPSLLFAALRNIFPSTFLWHHEPGFTPNETLP